MSVTFSILAQATAEDCSTVANLTTANSNLTEQVDLYLNRLYIKYSDIMALQMSMRNLQGELKNLKA